MPGISTKKPEYKTRMITTQNTKNSKLQSCGHILVYTKRITRMDKGSALDS